ncbi:hypothetical protein KKH23_05735, partial [Patescibacteria group bacterium]|nr:hypothetical protein [Patescibacteria group bacterium]
MELKTFVIGVALLLLTASISSNFAQSAPILSGNILYVGGSESGNYSKIQDAIDNAIDGDTVYVYNGIYTECDMLVDKSLNLVGESKEGVIVDSTGGFCSFKFLDVSNTNISSFTMKNGLMGILVEYHDTDVEHINIINCIIHDTQYYGIYTGGSNAYMRNSVIKNCEVYNTMNSITLRNFWTNTISD